MTTNAFKNMQLTSGQNLVALSVSSALKIHALIIIGQDESVFSQFSFNGMQWVGPSCERSILPKNDGIGVMVSPFQSREFGW